MPWSDPYRELLAKMPPVDEIERDAQRAHSSDSAAATAYLAGMLRGYYFFARDALQTVLDRIDREEQLRNDDGTVDLGRLPDPATDLTRHDFVGIFDPKTGRIRP
jgi:hypothetical protein